MLPLILSQKLHSLRATSGYHYLVSGTISPPYRGTFQLSLTVLLRYRSWEVFRIRSYCLPHSDPISNGPYSRKKNSNKKIRSYFFITQKKNPLTKWFTGLSPSTVQTTFQMKFNQKESKDHKNLRLTTPHLPTCYHAGFSLFYVVFARRY